MRALTLHVSALNDSEYDSYTDALNDLTADGNNVPASDEYYDKLSVGVREVRAWLRGRYSTLPLADVDTILKLFYPGLGQTDVLNGGQFFAVMRLVMHAKSGKGIDRSFAFMQVQLESISSTPPTSTQAPPPPPARRTSQIPSFSEADNNPFHSTSRSTTSKSAFLLPFPPPQSPQKPPTHPDTNMQSSSSSTLALKSTNPFLSRSKSDARLNGNNDGNTQKLPPLPPRKPTSLLASQVPPPTPARPLNLQPSLPVGKSVKTTHVLSPLMKQSLEASRVAHSMRKAEETLEKARVLQVLKSSSSNGSSSTSFRNTSSSPTKAGPVDTTASRSSSSSEDSRAQGYSSLAILPVLPPRRRKTSTPRSPSSLSLADSTMSFEQVANARVSPFLSRSPERGRTRPTLDNDQPRASSSSPSRHINITPPPMHPDRKVAPISTTDTQYTMSSTTPYYPISPTSPRAFRSKSLHHPKPPPPPPTRLARKRPESIQLSPSSSTFTLPPSASPGGTQGFSGLTRHISLSSTHSRASSIDSSPSVKSQIQKTLSSLQPKIDAARYKAEAGLSRKGYVNHTAAGPVVSPAFKHWAEEGEQSLIDGHGDEDDVTVDGSFSFDDDAEGPPFKNHDQSRTAGRSKVAEGGLDRDEMKWPTGDGWKPL